MIEPRAHQRVRLQCGAAVLELAPWVGGSVAAFRWRDEDVFRPASAEALEDVDPLRMASYPLIPFAGRITGGAFVFEGRPIALPANLPGESDAIHGQAWRAPWRVAHIAPSQAELTYDHPAGEWPWRYRASQVFTLRDDGLRQVLSVTNQSDRAMPAGLGAHPFFPRGHGVTLKAHVSGVIIDVSKPPAMIPTPWDWRRAPTIEAFVDNQFVGWNGEARVMWPERRACVTMTTSPPAPYLVVYAPEGEAFFCAEPVSHQLDAVNLSPGGAGHGMTILGPGQTTSISIDYALSAEV